VAHDARQAGELRHEVNLSGLVSSGRRCRLEGGDEGIKGLRCFRKLAAKLRAHPLAGSSLSS
jgi:hypothetical protein